MRRARFRGGVFAQPGSAALAASTAAFSSSRVESFSSPVCSPVAGLKIGAVRDEAEAVRPPPTALRMASLRGVVDVHGVSNTGLAEGGGSAGDVCGDRPSPLEGEGAGRRMRGATPHGECSPRIKPPSSALPGTFSREGRRGRCSPVSRSSADQIACTETSSFVCVALLVARREMSLASCVPSPLAGEGQGEGVAPHGERSPSIEPPSSALPGTFSREGRRGRWSPVSRSSADQIVSSTASRFARTS